MKARLKFFGQLALYWLFFFTVSRILFLVYLYAQTSTLTGKEIVMPIILGIRMDAAMTGYWLLIPGLIFLFSAFISTQWAYILQGFITSLLLFISTLLVVADLELYKHWGFRINATPLMYLESEAASSVNPAILILLVILFAVVLTSFMILYWKKLVATLVSNYGLVNYPHSQQFQCCSAQYRSGLFS
jgi:hypothetical protein